MNVKAAHGAAVERIVKELQEAWNASRHAHIFASIFRESTNAFRVLDVRSAADGVLLARISSVVDVPRGPLAGRLETIASAVLQRAGDGWEITLFHNTRVTERQET